MRTCRQCGADAAPQYDGLCEDCWIADQTASHVAPTNDRASVIEQEKTWGVDRHRSGRNRHEEG